jgi:hypothetical protein
VEEDDDDDDDDESEEVESCFCAVLERSQEFAPKPKSNVQATLTRNEAAMEE